MTGEGAFGKVKKALPYGRLWIAKSRTASADRVNKSDELFR